MKILKSLGIRPTQKSISYRLKLSASTRSLSFSLKLIIIIFFVIIVAKRFSENFNFSFAYMTDKRPRVIPKDIFLVKNKITPFNLISENIL